MKASLRNENLSWALMLGQGLVKGRLSNLLLPTQKKTRGSRKTQFYQMKQLNEISELIYLFACCSSLIHHFIDLVFDQEVLYLRTEKTLHG